MTTLLKCITTLQKPRRKKIKKERPYHLQTFVSLLPVARSSYNPKRLIGGCLLCILSSPPLSIHVSATIDRSSPYNQNRNLFCSKTLNQDKKTPFSPKFKNPFLLWLPLLNFKSHDTMDYRFGLWILSMCVWLGFWSAVDADPSSPSFHPFLLSPAPSLWQYLGCKQQYIQIFIGNDH